MLMVGHETETGPLHVVGTTAESEPLISTPFWRMLPRAWIPREAPAGPPKVKVKTNQPGAFDANCGETARVLPALSNRRTPVVVLFALAHVTFASNAHGSLDHADGVNVMVTSEDCVAA